MPDDEAKALMNAFVDRLNQIGVIGLQKEYAEIKALPPTGTTTAFEANRPKNRYQDVYCYDRTRVILTYNVPPDSDYIHANWIQDMGPSTRFICTQGPVADTMSDFFRMVWQEKPKSILMLCRVEENGKPKCAQYWPLTVGETQQVGILTVKNVKFNTNIDKSFDVTQIEVGDGKQAPISVDLFQWRDWPDKYVPSGGLGILRMLRAAKEKKKEAIIIVHCSAGIGRTGTVCALEVIMSKLETKQPVNIYEIVKELRTRRASSVQTEVQYVYLHRVIIEYLQAKGLSRPGIKKFIDEYSAYLAASKPPPH
ncbi:hypothetical protein L596_012298 [Steinernema carpocapsae]|uniref:Tyrosine-protein phosphatase domain-containing protein n=1 Tax=Steinernema carpocapsae TaxID=34508 RepID=A0A4U5NXH9_STECR|nr:hypothetical protein L596_012298 [Steinernema carpocapsae]